MIPGQETIDVNHTDLDTNESVDEAPNEAGQEGEPGILGHINPEDDIIDTIEKILTNEDNISFASGYIPALNGIETDQMRMIISSVLDMLREHGVDMFSAGDAGRAAKIRSVMGTTGIYLGTIASFIPTFHLIKGALASRKAADTDMTDEDWAAVSLTQPAPGQQPQQQQQQQQQPNGGRVDPESLINMPQPGQGGQPNRNFSGYGSNTPYPQQQRQQPRKMFTYEGLLRNHAQKHGTDGMGKAIAELRARNIDVNMNLGPQTGVPISANDPNSAWEREKRQAAMYGIQLPDSRDGLSINQQQQQAQRQQNLIQAPVNQQQQPVMPQQQQQPQAQPFPNTQSEMTSAGISKPTDASMAAMAQDMANIDFVGKVQNKNNLKQMPDFLLDELY